MGTVDTKQALADAVWFHRQTVQAWVKRDDWPFGEDGPWDVDEVRAWHRGTIGDPDNGVGAPEIARAERAAKLKIAVARGRNLASDRKRAEGLVHDVAECQEHKLAQIHAAKLAFLDLPRSVSPQLVGLQRAEIEVVLTAEVNRILTALATAY